MNCTLDILILNNIYNVSNVAGAPDPTAGGSAEEEHCWHLDSEQVKEQVGQYLTQGGYYNANKQLYFMFTKVLSHYVVVELRRIIKFISCDVMLEITHS